MWMTMTPTGCAEVSWKDKGINYPVAMASVQVRLAYGGIAALPTLFCH